MWWNGFYQRYYSFEFLFYDRKMMDKTNNTYLWCALTLHIHLNPRWQDVFVWNKARKIKYCNNIVKYVNIVTTAYINVVTKIYESHILPCRFNIPSLIMISCWAKIVNISFFIPRKLSTAVCNHKVAVCKWLGFNWKSWLS